MVGRAMTLTSSLSLLVAIHAAWLLGGLRPGDRALARDADDGGETLRKTSWRALLLGAPPCPA
jgi:hypothetical protein